MSVSVLILTFNEEMNLPACLESVKWSDDVVVFDSFSKDRTVEIARAAGARVIQRAFDNERAQREAALKIPFKHPWVYNPDADEVTPPELSDEMLRVVADAGRPEVAYRVRFRNMFMGRWLKYSSLYPTWVVRLFRPEKIRFERDINLLYLVDGPEGRLQEHFLHYTFNKGMSAWQEKHQRYAAVEAVENLRELRSCRLDFAGLFGQDPVRRRRAQKLFSMRLPCRFTLRFFYMYFWRLGFLDGYPGFTYCRLLAWYEGLIVQKMKELERREKGLPM